MTFALAIAAALFAREELDRHIELMTGSRPDPKTFVITAGKGEGDGFSIRSTNGVVTISGESPRGALYGVYELLERFGGCGWYAPWRTVVPKRERFVVPDGVNVTERLRVADSAPKPIVMGRDLIALGMKPGVEFGRILKAAYEAQLDGVFATHGEGIEFVVKMKGTRK